MTSGSLTIVSHRSHKEIEYDEVSELRMNRSRRVRVNAVDVDRHDFCHRILMIINTLKTQKFVKNKKILRCRSHQGGENAQKLVEK